MHTASRLHWVSERLTKLRSDLTTKVREERGAAVLSRRFVSERFAAASALRVSALTEGHFPGPKIGREHGRTSLQSSKDGRTQLPVLMPQPETGSS
jgi:hypothetical protein